MKVKVIRYATTRKREMNYIKFEGSLRNFSSTDIHILCLLDSLKSHLFALMGFKLGYDTGETFKHNCTVFAMEEMKELVKLFPHVFYDEHVEFIRDVLAK